MLPLAETRSGRNLRRTPHKIAAIETDRLRDASTPADPAVVADLVCNLVP